MIFYYSLLPEKQVGDTLIFSSEDQQNETKQVETLEEGPSFIHPPMHQQAQLLQTETKGSSR